MDFLRRLICGRITNVSCTPSSDATIPSVEDWFEHMQPTFLVLICVGCIMTLVVLLLGVLHYVFVLKFISNEQIRTDMYWLVFMAPVVSLCGCVGLILPRVAIFLYAIALVYFMICIFVLVCIMLTLLGSRSAMCEKLAARNYRINLQVCPLGCCLCCFPKLAPTELNFRRCEWLVFQSPIIRILLEILNIIVFMELNSRANLFFQLSNLIGIVSLFVGSYGSYLIIPAGASMLKEYRLLVLFRLVDLSQLAWSVQKLIADFLGAVGLVNGRHQLPMQGLPETAKAQFYISFLLCAEMLVVSLLATWMFRPSRTAFFDRFRRRQCGVGCAAQHHQHHHSIGDKEGHAVTLDAIDGGSDEFSSLEFGKREQSGVNLPLDQQVRFANGSGHTVSTLAVDCDEEQRPAADERPPAESFSSSEDEEETERRRRRHQRQHQVLEGSQSSISLPSPRQVPQRRNNVWHVSLS